MPELRPGVTAMPADQETTMKLHEFADYSGDRLKIHSYPNREHVAVLEIIAVGEGAGTTVHIPPHELAAIVTKMYRACDQPAPVLPVIHDEAQVEALSDIVVDVRGTVSSSMPVAMYHREFALALLARGVRLDVAP